MGVSTLPPATMANQRQAALEALGLQEGATPEDVRRAFRQKALLYHPDKNLHDPEGAAEQFRALVRAYRRLANPSSDQAWEDLQPEDILTEEFLLEALAQQLPTFELMYIQQRMSGSQEGAGLGPVWGEDLHGHATDKVWRRVHAAMQRRRDRQTGAAGSSDESRGRTRGDTETNPWSLFWEFITDLVARDEPQRTADAADPSGTNPNAHDSTEPDHQHSDEDHDTSYDYDDDMAGGGSEDTSASAVQRRERRRRYRAALLLEQAPQDTSATSHATLLQPVNSSDHTAPHVDATHPHNDEGVQEPGALQASIHQSHQPQQSQQQQQQKQPADSDLDQPEQHSNQIHTHTDSNLVRCFHDTSSAGGSGITSSSQPRVILSDKPVLLPVPNRHPTTTTAITTSGTTTTTSSTSGSTVYSIVPVDATKQSTSAITAVGPHTRQHHAGRVHFTSHDSEDHKGPGEQGAGASKSNGQRQARWLTLRNLWVWTRRILLVKAVLLLVNGE